MNPTPFMSHISYNPILAFAIYLVLHEIFFNKKISNLVLWLYSFFAISMIINMFITGGRAGQVMFFAVLSILIFQYFNFQKFKALFVVLIVISSVFFGAYQTSSLFYERVNATIYNIQNYEFNKVTSVGYRITFAINSWEVIMKNPIIGVGTGDFPTEYKKVNIKNTPKVRTTSNPHNMYILVLTQLGLIGLISFLLIFYYQIKLSFFLKMNLLEMLG